MVNATIAFSASRTVNMEDLFCSSCMVEFQKYLMALTLPRLNRSSQSVGEETSPVDG